MTHKFRIFLGLFIISAGIFAQNIPAVSADSLAKHVYYLASDDLGGRNTGSKGQKMAAEYIANYFEAFGLTPAGNSDVNPFFQEFIMHSDNLWIRFPEYQKESAQKYLRAGRNFLYFGQRNYEKKYVYETICSDKASCCGDSTVFRLFRAKSINALIDSAGFFYENCSNRKMMCILPDEELSLLSSNITTELQLLYNVNGTYENILSSGQQKGAKTEGFDRITSFVNSRESAELIIISPSFLKYFGYSPDADKEIDGLEFWHFKNVNDDSLRTENVIGYIEGDSQKGRVLVIGAHFDHVGQNSTGIFNGADDNASGTAALIELARHFSEAKQRGELEGAGIMFIAFSAEEKGLLGSKIYANHPYFPMDSTIFMLNMDMIGRPANYNGKTANTFFIAWGSQKKALNKAVRKSSKEAGDMKTYFHPGLINRMLWKVGSDHQPFIRKGVTSGVFFTGMHEDYHKTTDTAEKINYKNMASITALVYLTAITLAK